MPHIIVDSRESRSQLALLLARRGATVETAELESGDFILAQGLGVERKAAADFVGSLINRRVFSQVPLLKATYKTPIFLVEGDIYKVRSDIEDAALDGAVSWLIAIEKIPVIFTRSIEHTADMMLTLARHATDGLGYEIALRASKPKDRSSQVQFLIEGLPGVGPKAAQKLVSHFGTPHAVFGASANELRACAGIGPKTAVAIREVLDFDGRIGS